MTSETFNAVGPSGVRSWACSAPASSRFEQATSTTTIGVLFSISEGKRLLLLGAQKPISKDDMELARARKRDADRATAERKVAAVAKVKKKKP
jgi:hypothetical protein